MNSDMINFPGRSNRYTSNMGYNPGQPGAGTQNVPAKPVTPVRGGQELGSGLPASPAKPQPNYSAPAGY